jgi:hypothetical protein
LGDAAAMKRACLLSVALLFACQEQKPKFTDEQMREVRAESPWMTDECLEKMQWGGIKAVTGDCTRRSPAARWRGLWRTDFEGSLFCPAPAQTCSNSVQGRRIALEVDPYPAAMRNTKPGGLYAVEFIGRRSSHGTAMEVSGYKADIRLDRLISIRQIEPPPPEPTRAEMIAHFKKCEAAKSCIPNWAMINSMEE